MGKIQENSPFMTLVLGDFNAKSKSWFKNGITFLENYSFSVVNNIEIIAGTLNNDLTPISNWAFQWKIIFNPNLTKQAQ